MEALLRLLLVENQPLSARMLTLLVRGLGYEPLGPVPTAAEALDLLRESLHSVDVALLDIGLDGDQDGIELAQELLAIRPLPIIFLTSLADAPTFGRAKQVRPAAFLFKPYEAVALELAVLNFAAGRPAPLPAALREPDAALPALPLDWTQDVVIRDCLFVRERNRLVKVCLDDVRYIEASEKYSALITATGRYMVRLSLRELALELPARQFVQVQRSYMVNAGFIESCDEGCTTVTVAGQTLPVGRTYRNDLLRRLRLVG
ncbi:MAG: LytR/AlgR family response regulator transcription factor [Janthinobacterium lividum]